jgi:hypothetical protein
MTSDPAQKFSIVKPKPFRAALIERIAGLEAGLKQLSNDFATTTGALQEAKYQLEAYDNQAPVESQPQTSQSIPATTKKRKAQ